MTNNDTVIKEEEIEIIKTQTTQSTEKEIPKVKREIKDDDTDSDSDNYDEKDILRNKPNPPDEIKKGEWKDNIRKIRNSFFPKSKNKATPEIGEGNHTNEPERVYEPLYKAPELSRQALLTTVLMQSVVNNLEELSEKTNKEIKKSAALTDLWKKQIEALDKFIKSLAETPWAAILKWSACFFIFTGFLYKMGILRMIPDFASGIINILPMPSSLNPTKTVENISENIKIPNPKIESTFSMLMETPITPLALLTGIGILTVSITTLKVLVWTLRKLPK